MDGAAPSGFQRVRRPSVWPRLAVAPWLVVGVLLLVSATPASGLVNIVNAMMAQFVADDGPRFYPYDSGDMVTVEGQAAFDAGTYQNAQFDSAAAGLTLIRAGEQGPVTASWWDPDWVTRRCLELDNPGGPLTEHPIRIEFDSTSEVANGWVQADGSDLRAVAADDATGLPFWLESGLGTTSTVAWVQVDAIPTGTSTICLYMNNAGVPSVSSEAAVFTYSTPTRSFYPAYYRLDGSSGNNGSISIVSYVNGNTVSVDGVTQTLNQGQVGTWNGATEASVILSTGPVGGRGLGDGMDSIVPASFAGTIFNFPTNRGTQRWTLQTLSGTAQVEIRNGTALAWSGTVGTTPVAPTVDVGGNRSGTIRSTNGVPILVTHTASQRYDSLTVPPFFGDDIYGVRSRGTWLGVLNGGTSFDVYRSDGTQQSFTLAAGGISQIYDGADLDGNGTAVRITNMTGPTGGLQQADRDGWDSTSYLPERLLESSYYLPTNAQYLAFACPTPGTTILIGGASRPCNTPGPGFPGHAHFGAAAAGTHVRSAGGERFFAYYEDLVNNDETNLFGMKASQKPTPVPIAVSAKPTEGQYPTDPDCGLWTSPVYDTTATGSGIFGLIEALETTVDPGGNTSVSFQVASGADAAAAGAASFVGPDGTAATFYEPGQPVAYALDGVDQFVRLQVVLKTTDPTVAPVVTRLKFGHDLVEDAVNPSVSAVTHDGSLHDTWLYRVITPQYSTTTSLLLMSVSNETAATDIRVFTDHPADHIVISGGGVNQAQGPQSFDPADNTHSVGVSAAGAANVELETLWIASPDSAGIQIDHGINISFGP